MSQNYPTNLGAAIARSPFHGAPLEFVVPKNTEVIFVSDFFVNGVQGGAELTTEAIIEKSPYRLFRMHSASVTPTILEKNKDKYWILGNFSIMPAESLSWFIQNSNNSEFKYSIVEYDFKYCVFRSEELHRRNTEGQSCDCALRPHGLMIERLYLGSQHIFWMSDKQKDHFCSRVPSLAFSAKENFHVLQSSTFSDATIEKLVQLRELHQEAMSKTNIKVWGVLGSGSWIKGTQETVQYCANQKMSIKILQNMAYDQFLTELAKCYGFVFCPLDFDTCPRTVIEAKMMGCAVSLNNNVLHKDEPWFLGSISETENFLRSRGTYFWNFIKL